MIGPAHPDPTQCDRNTSFSNYSGSIYEWVIRVSILYNLHFHILIYVSWNKNNWVNESSKDAMIGRKPG